MLFQKDQINLLPVQYRNNKKAWMTSTIFDDWLRSFDKKMRSQKRNVLLFVDNAPSHPRATVKNAKLVFLPDHFYMPAHGPGNISDHQAEIS